MITNRYFYIPDEGLSDCRIERIRSIKAGLEKHGMIHRTDREPSEGDIAIAYAWMPRFQRLHKKGVNVLVVERGFVKRGPVNGWEPETSWLSLGFNGVCRGMKAHTPKDGGERWRKWFSDTIKPWKNGDGNGEMVVMGQVEGDANLNGMDMPAYYKFIRKHYLPIAPNKRLLFKPHPALRFKMPHLNAGYKIIMDGINETLEIASHVFTYSSNTAVDAVLAGVPSFSFSENSMAWDVTEHTPGVMPKPVDRDKWCAWLAWRQWTWEEIRNGQAWDVIKETQL